MYFVAQLRQSSADRTHSIIDPIGFLAQLSLFTQNSLEVISSKLQRWGHGNHSSTASRRVGCGTASRYAIGGVKATL